MVTQLTKPVSRELMTLRNIIVTMTDTGITFKVRRRHRSVTIPWEVLIGSGAMMQGENLNTMMRGCKIVLGELGYKPEIPGSDA